MPLGILFTVRKKHKIMNTFLLILVVYGKNSKIKLASFEINKNLNLYIEEPYFIFKFLFRFR